MKRTMIALTIMVSAFSIVSCGSDNQSRRSQAEDQGYQSLRGKDVPSASADAVGMDWKEGDASINRTFVHQPPLIPHDTKEYMINTSTNDCLDCHGEKDSGAPMPHSSHYLDRDGKKTDKVSSRWYFCSQCHVGQVEAKPLVENTFKAK